MTTTIPDFAHSFHHLLTTQADDVAQAVGFVQRQRKLTGARFAQSLVFGHLSEPASSLEDLCQTFIHTHQIALHRQSVHERFTARAAHFMERLVLVGVQIYCQGPSQSHAFFRPFSEVYVMDSTVIALPESLAPLWRGTQAGGLKLHVRLNLTHGGFEQVALSDGRMHDQHHEMTHDLGTPGSLHMTDLGYFNLERFHSLSDSERFWLSRYKGGVRLRTLEGDALDILMLLDAYEGDVLDREVQVGQKRPLRCRLIARRAPPEVVAQRQKDLREWEVKHQRKASVRRWALCA